MLALYAYVIVYISGKGWISAGGTGKAGTAVVGVLSMVTGLLLSYRFSSAISKWDEGKKVWVQVGIEIRSGIRMLSIRHNTSPYARSSSSTSSHVDLGDLSSTGSEDVPAEAAEKLPKESPSLPSLKEKTKEQKDVLAERVDELSGLLVGFAFALQHHLHETRPLPQPPLCDLLPQPYLSSLKRTEARVRFAEAHAGPSGSGSASTDQLFSPSSEDVRPGLRRRSTGPPTKEDRDTAESLEEWEMGNLRDRAEEAVQRLAAAVGGDGTQDGELRQQLSQLNLPDRQEFRNPILGTSGKPKSNIHLPRPPNLPLALLKLMEGYVIALAEVPCDQGGWSEAKRERALGVVNSLGKCLGEAERLCSTPPPLPLSLHLSHLLMIYLVSLPCALLSEVSGPLVVLITVLAGWCLLGLEAVAGEVGAVFGPSEIHHPLPLITNQILLESVDISPAFMSAYRGRLSKRTGEDSEEVAELDRRCRRGVEEWMPFFAI
ncbi:ion channel-forming bestrophin family protein, partial [Tremellales sp. Uapishka_1]